MPAPGSQRTPGPWERRLIAALTNQLALKVTAVCLAVGLWFIVGAKEPLVNREERVELVTVRFEPIMDSSLVLRDPLPPIQALVAGSPKTLAALNANPPVIRRRISSDVPDTVVVDLRPSDVILPDGIDAEVRQIGPKSVTLRFEPTWSRQVPVRSAIDVANAPNASGRITLEIDPRTVEVSGPRHLVARIPYVTTTRTTITFPDSLPHLVELDTTGLGDGIRLHPPQVKVLLLSSSRPQP